MAQDSLIICDSLVPKKFGLALNTSTLLDSAGNQVNSGAKSTFSTITATNHNFAGATPDIVLLNQQSGTATATAAGTIGATQYTPTGGVSATYVAYTMNI